MKTILVLLISGVGQPGEAGWAAAAKSAHQERLLTDD